MLKELLFCLWCIQGEREASIYWEKTFTISYEEAQKKYPQQDLIAINTFLDKQHETLETLLSLHTLKTFFALHPNPTSHAFHVAMQILAQSPSSHYSSLEHYLESYSPPAQFYMKRYKHSDLSQKCQCPLFKKHMHAHNEFIAALEEHDEKRAQSLLPTIPPWKKLVAYSCEGKTYYHEIPLADYARMQGLEAIALQLETPGTTYDDTVASL